MANTSINRAFSSSSTNTKATWSFWIKRNKVSVEQWIFQTRDAASNNYRTYIRFAANDQMDMRIYNTNATLVGQLQTNRVFRDVNAWYHIVYRMDTTQANTGHRLRLYVNGVEETSFSVDTQMNNGQQVRTVSSGSTAWGRNAPSNDTFLDGCLSHVNFIEGEDRTPDFFGEYDANGVWKIKTSPTGFTYGSNGYFILKDGNSVTDQSGNSNNFTVAGGTLTKTEDCPSNVFATLNPLARFQVAPTYSNGNNTITAGAGGSGSSPFSTIGASSGKYYAELSLGSVSGGGISCGIIDITKFNPNFQTDAWFYYPTYGYAYMSSNGNKGNNNAETSYANSYTNGDRIGVAMDLDNNKLYFAKNGVWQNSGDPTSGATGTGAAFTIADGTYGFAVYGYDSKVWNANFGNGYFGTTAVSSAGTNASGNGIFEYDVPTGFTALSTKGLNL